MFSGSADPATANGTRFKLANRDDPQGTPFFETSRDDGDHEPPRKLILRVHRVWRPDPEKRPLFTRSEPTDFEYQLVAALPVDEEERGAYLRGADEEQRAALRQLAEVAGGAKYERANAPVVIRDALRRAEHEFELLERVLVNIGVLCGCPYNQFIELES